MSTGLHATVVDIQADIKDTAAESMGQTGSGKLEPKQDILLQEKHADQFEESVPVELPAYLQPHARLPALVSHLRISSAMMLIVAAVFLLIMISGLVTQKGDVPIRLGVQAFFIVPSLVAGILGCVSAGRLVVFHRKLHEVRTAIPGGPSVQLTADMIADRSSFNCLLRIVAVALLAVVAVDLAFLAAEASLLGIMESTHSYPALAWFSEPLSRHEMIAFEIMFGCLIGVISLLIMIALYGSITLFKAAYRLTEYRRCIQDEVLKLSASVPQAEGGETKDNPV